MLPYRYCLVCLFIYFLEIVVLAYACRDESLSCGHMNYDFTSQLTNTRPHARTHLWFSLWGIAFDAFSPFACHHKWECANFFSFHMECSFDWFTFMVFLIGYSTWCFLSTACHHQWENAKLIFSYEVFIWLVYMFLVIYFVFEKHVC